MLGKSLAGAVLYRRPDEPAAGQSSPNTPNTPNAPQPEYATLGPDAPIAWPTGARRVPVTGQLSPHAQAALERMGITKHEA